MSSKCNVWTIVLLLGLVGQTVDAKTASAVNDPRSLAAIRGPVDRGDFPAKPHGWLRFEEACAIGSSFAATLDRAKRSRDRIVIRHFGAGNLYQQNWPAALGLDCVPYSVGFD